MNIQTVMTAIQSGIPVLLWGKPGTGKTSFIKSVARDMSLPLEVVIASIREPTDFAGLPVVTKTDDVRFAPPGWAKRLAALEKEKVEEITAALVSLEGRGKGILLLDELSTAPPAVQSALLRVVLERVVGDIALPSSIWIVACANPTDTSSGTWTLSAALANRFCHLDWIVSPLTWIEGMNGGWIGEGKNLGRWTSLITAFIKCKPNLLLQEPEDTENAGGPWPSPRSWEMVIRLAAMAESKGLAEEETMHLVGGCVGRGAQVELFTWIRESDLPDPETWIANPKKISFPKRQDQVFAILLSVVSAVKERLTAERWEAGWEILGQAATAGMADVAAIPAKTLAKVKSGGLKIPTSVKAFLPVLQAAGLITND